MPKAPQNTREFEGLVKVVEHLRGPDGCPWDKEQNHKTLTRFAIEEAHEFAEAVDGGDPEQIKEELGDVLLQVVLNAEVARQEGKFDVYDVVQSISDKMIRRHPHVFGDVKVGSSDEVLKNWGEIKAEEKREKKKAFSFDMPKDMPALLRAHKIGEKTKRVAFDWDNADQCWEKVAEEYGELREALDSKDRAHIEAELGDLLFCLSQLARHLDMDSEQALRITNTRFEKRFAKMQDLVKADGKDWETLPAPEKEIYWKKAKP
jgi:tetrapyrrole methylase family protein/MazG family protein